MHPLIPLILCFSGTLCPPVLVWAACSRGPTSRYRAASLHPLHRVDSPLLARGVLMEEAQFQPPFQKRPVTVTAPQPSAGVRPAQPHVGSCFPTLPGTVVPAGAWSPAPRSVECGVPLLAHIHRVDQEGGQLLGHAGRSCRRCARCPVCVPYGLTRQCPGLGQFSGWRPSSAGPNRDCMPLPRAFSKMCFVFSHKLKLIETLRGWDRNPPTPALQSQLLTWCCIMPQTRTRSDMAKAPHPRQGHYCLAIRPH